MENTALNFNSEIEFLDTLKDDLVTADIAQAVTREPEQTAEQAFGDAVESPTKEKPEEETEAFTDEVYHSILNNADGLEMTLEMIYDLQTDIEQTADVEQVVTGESEQTAEQAFGDAVESPAKEETEAYTDEVYHSILNNADGLKMTLEMVYDLQVRIESLEERIAAHNLRASHKI